MKNSRKLVLLIAGSLLLTIIGILSVDAYRQYITHRFEVVEEDNFYKSGEVPVDELEDYITKHKIKTVIDLRYGSVQDELNPASDLAILNEKNAVSKLKNVNYYNVASLQIPTQQNLEDYFEILNNPNNYPIWVHCADGIGRANLYAALYKIEFLGYTNEEARRETRWPLVFSNFDKGTGKGEFLIHYQKQNTDDNHLTRF